MRRSGASKRVQEEIPEGWTIFEKELENSLSFYDSPKLNVHKISSTNRLKRLSRYIRKRSVIVGVFPPSEKSYVRFVVTYLMENGEDSSTNRCYLNPVVLAGFNTAIRLVA